MDICLFIFFGQDFEIKGIKTIMNTEDVLKSQRQVLEIQRAAEA